MEHPTFTETALQRWRRRLFFLGFLFVLIAASPEHQDGEVSVGAGGGTYNAIFSGCGWYHAERRALAGGFVTARIPVLEHKKHAIVASVAATVDERLSTYPLDDSYYEQDFRSLKQRRIWRPVLHYSILYGDPNKKAFSEVRFGIYTYIFSELARWTKPLSPQSTTSNNGPVALPLPSFYLRHYAKKHVLIHLSLLADNEYPNFPLARFGLGGYTEDFRASFSIAFKDIFTYFGRESTRGDSFVYMLLESELINIGDADLVLWGQLAPGHAGDIRLFPVWLAGVKVSYAFDLWRDEKTDYGAAVTASDDSGPE